MVDALTTRVFYKCIFKQDIQIGDNLIFEAGAWLESDINPIHDGKWHHQVESNEVSIPLRYLEVTKWAESTVAFTVLAPLPL